MIKKMLLDCTTTILKILIKQYEEGNLKYDDLITNSKLKKAFLEESLSDFEDNENKIYAQEIIYKLNYISINHVK